MIAEVVFPIPLNKTFTYQVPEKYENIIFPGMRVIVPFGKRKECGYVISVKKEVFNNIGLKNIIELNDNIPVITEELFKIASWLSDTYLCSIGEAFGIILPPGIFSRKAASEQENYKNNDNKIDISERNNRKSLKQIFIYQYESEPFSCYFDLIKDILKEGNCIFLFPEIILTSTLTDRFFSIVDKKDVCIWHSKIPAHIRYKNWIEILKGNYKMVIGTRSAIFCPLDNIKLIIIHNETDTSFKEITKPNYNAVEVAKKRAEYSSGNLILGGKIPSLESYYYLKKKKYTFLTYPSGKNLKPEIKIKIIDMTLSKSKGTIPPSTRKYVSEEFKKSILKRLARNEISIIYLNRKGFSSAVFCKKCKKVYRCPSCNLPLVYHNNLQLLKCHYCNFKEKYEEICECGSNKKIFLGTGTERILKIVESLFPSARILKFDSDFIDKPSKLKDTLDLISSGEFDIIITTQMLLPYAEVVVNNSKLINSSRKITLAVCANIDKDLYIPDYKSSEHVFIQLYQLLSFISQDGEMIIQTNNSKHYIFRNIIKQNWESFYRKELKYRKELFYPPFSKIVEINIEGKEENALLDESSILKKYFKTINDKIIIIGPVDIEKKSKLLYRTKVLLKIKTENFYTLTSKLKEYIPVNKVHISFLPVEQF